VKPGTAHPGAALVLSLRGPLARIELLAGRLVRSAPSPAEREIGEAISCAVAELDGIVGQVLALFAPPPEVAAAQGPVGPVLDEVVERLAPALAARGLACTRDRRGDGALVGLARARRAAIELLDGVSRELSSGSALRLGARERSGCVSLVVAVEAGQTGGASCAPPECPEAVVRLDECEVPVYERALGGGGGGCTAS